MDPRPSARRSLLLTAAAAPWLLAAFLTPGCAPSPRVRPEAVPVKTTPSAFVALLAGPKGEGGGITVSNPAGLLELSRPNSSVSVEGPDVAPGAPYMMSDAEVEERFGKTIAAQPPPPVRFELYFDTDSGELAGESLEKIPAIMEAIRERQPADVSVIGHTDTVGLKGYNFQLALRRATTVAGLLAARGADREALDVASHGEGNLLVPTPDETPEPRNRRVEVTVR